MKRKGEIKMRLVSIHPGQTAYFYRYQGTKEMEQRSRYVDIELLYEDIVELRLYQPGITEAELEEELYWKYEETFALRSSISAKDLFLRVCRATDFDEIEKMIHDYPVDGIFGYLQEEIDEDYDWEELISGGENIYFWHCDYRLYLTLYEGELIQDEGESGVIFKPAQLVKVWETSRHDE